jgi:quinol monooxygenase YgiN
MITITGYLRFRPEDRDLAIAGLKEVSELSRKDAGCVDYWWAEDLESPNTFRFFETWESPELFEAHRAAPYEQAFNERYLTRITGAEAYEYTVTGRRPATG